MSAIDFPTLLKATPDDGTTNVRRTDSKHWTRWLGPANRCLVPFTSFSEWDSAAGEPVWFAAGAERPLMVFGGIWKNWTSVRKAREGEVTVDCFGFLTTDPNSTVGAIHLKAMPVILTTAEEMDVWMRADWAEAKALQHAAHVARNITSTYLCNLSRAPFMTSSAAVDSWSDDGA